MYRLANRSGRDRSRFSAVSPLFADFERLFQEADRFFEPTTERHVPTLHSHKTEDGYLVTVDVPGLSEEDVNLDIHNQVLTLSASKDVQLLEGHQAVKRERRALKFSQSLRLPEDVDPEKVSAKMKAGVLSVTLGKRDEVKPRRIKVATV